MPGLLLGRRRALPLHVALPAPSHYALPGPGLAMTTRQRFQRPTSSVRPPALPVHIGVPPSSKHACDINRPNHIGHGGPATSLSHTHTPLSPSMSTLVECSPLPPGSPHTSTPVAFELNRVVHVLFEAVCVGATAVLTSTSIPGCPHAAPGAPPTHAVREPPARASKCTRALMSLNSPMRQP